MIPVKDFHRLMNRMAEATRVNMPNILFNAMLVSANNMEWRVFNRGTTINGSTLRYRSAPYKKRREKRGRQVEYKDFQMTDNMFNSLNVIGQSETKVTYGFASDETSGVARNVTDQIGLQVSDLFGLSQDEKTEARDIIEADLGEVYNKIVANHKGTKVKFVEKQQKPEKPHVKAYEKGKKRK